jgi:hypothetical protein
MKTKAAFLTFVLLISSVWLAYGQADHFTALVSKDSIKIDGIADDSVWIQQPDWYPMNYVWIPYNASVTPEDFTGKFKCAWDSNYFYILVEIVDDSLFDGHSNPLDNYYQDDCVEIFLDEDHSGGPHNDASNAFNAFAMHVSTFFDVVDNGKSGTALFNNLVTGARTRNDSLYTWELQVKVYPSTYNPSSPGDPEKLTANKEMGFSLAYCDDDGSNTRENFFGSKYLDEANANNSWLNASLFGTLTLIDPDVPVDTSGSDTTISDLHSNFRNNLLVFPSISHNTIRFSSEALDFSMPVNVTVFDLNGTTMMQKSYENQTKSMQLSIENLPSGTYVLRALNGSNQFLTRFVKQ